MRQKFIPVETDTQHGRLARCPLNETTGGIFMLQTERLIFREMEESDQAIIAQIMRDEGVQRIWEHYFTDVDVKDWIARRRSAYQNNGIDYLLAIRKETNEVVGQIGLLKENIEGEEVWGIGYILMGPYCGMGYATEGAKAMADYAFHTLHVPRLVCDIRPMNTASIAVAKRIGMVETGSFVKHYKGMEMPHLIFELQNNIYDNNDFFAAYASMDRSRGGLEAAGEWHQLKLLFPDVTDKKVLDLGCGYGWHCKYAVSMGASEVLGLDGSTKMLAAAQTQNADDRIRYEHCDLLEYAYPKDTFDLVISNLVLHYIENLDNVYRSVYCTLKKGGCFLFNIEHPSFTAGVNQDWIYDENGTPLYWPMDNYYYPGLRETNFLGHNVAKYHHTLTQILNPLLQMGFSLEAVEEAGPPAHMMHLPGMADEMRRPMMLLVKAVKR